MNSAERKKLFTEFLKSNKVLIADKNSTSRSRLRKTLLDMGAEKDNILLCSAYSEALELINEHRPPLVLSDYSIKNGSGFDLFREYKLTYPELKNIISILITSDGSQSLVAKAAEEDVDSFLIKPYTVKGLEENLTNAVMNKLYPSDYIIKINEGKELLFADDYKGALDLFSEAIKMSQTPSLALFYHGQAQYLLELVGDAQEDYKRGLEINKIHFKCQIGLYETFKKQGKTHEAYEVVRNVARLFPANPDRLAEVVRLCVVTENYHDMLEYYNLYTNLNTRDEALKKHVMAGMYITGKYNLLQNNRDGASIFFNKVSVSCGDDVQIFNSMLNLTADYEMFDLGRELLAKYPLGKEGSSFEVFDYRINFDKLSDFEKVNKAEYITKNISKDSAVFSLLLSELAKDDSKKDLYNSYLAEASKLWPEKFSQVA